MSLLTKTIDILKKIKEKGTANIKFTKKDGTERIMKCTVIMDNVPKEKRPKKVEITNIMDLAKKGLIRVFDVEKQDWRSVNCEKIKIME